MLTNMEVYSDNSSPPDLPLTVGGSDGTDLIQIRGIDGLGPVKADVGTRALGSGDGEFYTGSQLPKRNIVLTLGLNPDWQEYTMSSLRAMLYGFFMTKRIVRLRFFDTERPTVEIEGVVESFEPNIFSKDPEIQISVICPQPDFVAVEAIQLTGTATDTAVFQEFTYRGNVNSGIIFELHNAVGSPDYEGLVTLENKTLALDTKSFGVSGSVDASSIIRITSGQGSKSAKNIFGPEEVSLLTSRVAGSIWPELEPGVNKFRALIASSTGKPWTLEYYERFGGL